MWIADTSSNSTIRELIDLLAESEERKADQSDDELPQYVLQLMQQSLMQLVLDLGLRYRT
ncbi:MAG: hypothetical protein U5J63_07950 [Fodinibius sp.]|nr:hypothetical protein [Fodinibius sp.]